ncbi:TPA: hypothetical protein DF272_05520 [Candidatus Falkowbacteria bacterium]|nr:hypothetical protein [Candidatus Falkowbacteria bacterium]
MKTAEHLSLILASFVNAIRFNLKNSRSPVMPSQVRQIQLGYDLAVPRHHSVICGRPEILAEVPEAVQRAFLLRLRDNDRELIELINRHLLIAEISARITRSWQFYGETVSHGTDIDPYLVEIETT